MNGRKTLIFGAGVYGKRALDELGNENVEAFIDNDKSKWGKLYYGKRIVAPKDIFDYGNVNVVIASIYSNCIAKQLTEMDIKNFSFFISPVHGYYEKKDIVYNPYKDKKIARNEAEWSNSKKIEYARREVFIAAEKLFNNQTLFNHVEVETINRCNGVCGFCPVNKKNDTRQKAVMKEDLFKNIVQQLHDIDYTGRFTTFSNNEPLLDERIIDFNLYARKNLPKARLHMFTNGTLLTLEKFKVLAECLDELVIDNYRDDLELIKPCKEIKEYCELHPELIEKVTIVLRKPNEILTSRGGNAPNRKELIQYSKDRCVLPFKQMIIRPTGKISLCCNDALGEYTLGDASKEKLIDIWYVEKYKMVRNALYEGRENWGHCKFCDTFAFG